MKVSWSLLVPLEPLRDVTIKYVQCWDRRKPEIPMKTSPINAKIDLAFSIACNNDVVSE